MKPIGFIPRLARVTPISETSCTAFMPGFAVWCGAIADTQKHRFPLGITESESLSASYRTRFAIWGSSGIAILPKVFEWGLFLVWVASCEPHGYTCIGLRSAPIPDLTSYIDEPRISRRKF
jgi:hypothetical protein